MATNDNTHDLSNFDFGICKKKARQIIGRAGFKRQDREDIEQTLLCRVVQALKSYDPSRGDRKAYITAVVERALANALRDAMAQKRDPRRIISLNVIVDVMDDGPIERADTISDHERNARHRRDPRTAEELAQLISDLAVVLAMLPDDDREIAELLKELSVTAAARELGEPRSAVVRAVQRILKRFENGNLRDYFE